MVVHTSVRLTILVLLFFCSGIFTQEIIYFVDENPHLFAEHKKCVDKIYGSLLDGFYDGPNMWWLLADHLRKAGYTVYHVRSVQDIHEDYYCLVITNIKLGEMSYLAAHRDMFPAHKLILTMWEPPSVNPYNYYPKFHQLFGKILTWADDIVENNRYFKLFYPRQDLYMVSDPVPFKDKKICCMIAGLMESTYAGELYTERLKTIEYFEQCKADDFDLFGERGYKDRVFRTYKGCVPHKIETLKKYRFCICYENVRGLNGYVTEKIFDCFHAGCVPVYWGAENISYYIPRQCYIDRRFFSSNEDLYNFLRNMKEQEYENYLQAIEDYLIFDERAQWFSVDNFICTLCNLILNIK